MIRVTETSLIIEIPSKNSSPLETLANLQSGMHDIMNCIDYTHAPAANVEWGMHQMITLLKEMAINPDQLAYINKSITQGSANQVKFNKL